MTENEHKTMNVVAEDAPEKASPEHVSGMLQDLRQFINEHDSASAQKFQSWSEGYKPRSYQHYFGSWNNAVEAVGGEPNRRHTRVSKEEAKRAVDNAAQQRIEWEEHGRKKVSPEGQAPPSSALRHIDSIENLPTETAFVYKFDRTYTELARDLGHDTVTAPSKGSGGYSERSSYDWDEVEETLRKEIEEEKFWRARDRYIDPGEIPTNRYINRHDDLPAAKTLYDRYGPKEDWKQELGLEEERNTNDVNVDQSDFGL